MLTSFWEPQLQLLSTVARHDRLCAADNFASPVDQEILIASVVDFLRRRHRYWLARGAAFLPRDHATEFGKSDENRTRAVAARHERHECATRHGDGTLLRIAHRCRSPSGRPVRQEEAPAGSPVRRGGHRRDRLYGGEGHRRDARMRNRDHPECLSLQLPGGPALSCEAEPAAGCTAAVCRGHAGRDHDFVGREESAGRSRREKDESCPVSYVRRRSRWRAGSCC